MERIADGTRIGDWTEAMTAALEAMTAADVMQLTTRIASPSSQMRSIDSATRSR
jgi:hypothetical protein